MFCPECGANNEEWAKFCDGCGKALRNTAEADQKIHAAIPSADMENGIVTKIEKRIYFKIARGFAWFILSLSTVSLIGATGYLVKTSFYMFGGKSSVTKEEVATALSEQKRGMDYVVEDSSSETANLELLKKLDAELIDVIYLFPDHIRRNERDIDAIKQEVKNSIAYWRNIKDRISVLKEMKNELKDFSQESEKMVNAILKYIQLKQAKEEAKKARVQEAYIKLGSAAGAILSVIIIITHGSLILVLMAIERNTRRGV